MSVLVKGMKMPENCIKCPLQFGGWCYASPPEIDERVAPTVDEAWEQGKPDWCPLVALPDHHGRLVDADALEKEGWSLHRDIRVDKNTREYQTKPLRQVPTIEPQRKKGKWLPDNNSVYEMRFVCSECKESQVVPTIGFTKYKPIWDFCPYCGARMEDEG